MVDAPITNWVKACLKRGYSQQQIRFQLLQHGYNDSQINTLFLNLIDNGVGNSPLTSHKTILLILALIPLTIFLGLFSFFFFQNNEVTEISSEMEADDTSLSGSESTSVLSSTNEDDSPGVLRSQSQLQEANTRTLEEDTPNGDQHADTFQESSEENSGEPKSTEIQEWTFYRDEFTFNNFDFNNYPNAWIEFRNGTEIYDDGSISFSFFVRSGLLARITFLPEYMGLKTGDGVDCTLIEIRKITEGPLRVKRIPGSGNITDFSNGEGNLTFRCNGLTPAQKRGFEGELFLKLQHNQQQNYSGSATFILQKETTLRSVPGGKIYYYTQPGYRSEDVLINRESFPTELGDYSLNRLTASIREDQVEISGKYTNKDASRIVSFGLSQAWNPYVDSESFPNALLLDTNKGKVIGITLWGWPIGIFWPTSNAFRSVAIEINDDYASDPLVDFSNNPVHKWIVQEFPIDENAYESMPEIKSKKPIPIQDINLSRMDQPEAVPDGSTEDDIPQCEQMENPENCYLELATNREDASICKNLIMSSTRDSCYLSISIDTENPIFCDMISDTITKNRCENREGQKTSDKEDKCDFGQFKCEKYKINSATNSITLSLTNNYQWAGVPQAVNAELGIGSFGGALTCYDPTKKIQNWQVGETKVFEWTNCNFEFAGFLKNRKRRFLVDWKLQHLDGTNRGPSRVGVFTNVS